MLRDELEALVIIGFDQLDRLPLQRYPVDQAGEQPEHALPSLPRHVPQAGNEQGDFQEFSHEKLKSGHKFYSTGKEKWQSST